MCEKELFTQLHEAFHSSKRPDQIYWEYQIDRCGKQISGKTLSPSAAVPITLNHEPFQLQQASLTTYKVNSEFSMDNSQSQFLYDTATCTYSM